MVGHWLKRLLWPVFIIVVVLLLGWAVESSQTFQICLQHGYGDPAHAMPKPNQPALDTAIADGTVIAGCVGDFTDRNRDGLTTLGIIVLAVFTVALWAATRGMLKATARSAKIVQRALTDLETPVVLVEIIDPGLSVESSPSSGAADATSPEEPATRYVPGELRYRFVNYGRTPARIVAIADDLRPIGPGGTPPFIDADTDLTEELPWGFMIPPNGGHSEEFALQTIERMTRLRAGEVYERENTRMVFSVGLRYADVLENRFVMGSCFQFEQRPSGDRWALIQRGHPYNYRRPEGENMPGKRWRRS